MQIVADHDHLLWIDTDAVGGRQESLGRRLADGGGGLAAGLFHSGQVHPGVDAQPVGGVPGHIAVHRHHRNAVEHPPIDPAERAVIELGAGTAEHDDVGGFGAILGTDLGRQDDVDAGQVLGDVAVVHQEAPRAGIGAVQVLGRQHPGRDHVVGGDGDPRGTQRLGDLPAGARRGVGQIRAGDSPMGQLPHGLGGPGNRAPRQHQHAVDVEQHRRGHQMRHVHTISVS